MPRTFKIRTSNNMGQLIDLRLQPSTDTRLPSISSPSTPTNIFPAFATKSIHRPRPGPVTDLTIFPYTEGEWLEVMKEARFLYMSHKYKQCSARCIQILESIKDPYRVHPLYQIYLSFFAASSLELTSRSLHLNSSTKLPLLQQSLQYYQYAESKMEFAFFSTDPRIVHAVRQTRRNSICSSASSIRSSVDSVFSSVSSRFSAASSIAPTLSPTTSCYSTSSGSSSSSEIPFTQKSALSAPPSQPGTGLEPAPLKIKKKVAFSLQLPRILSAAELEIAEDSTIIDSFPYPPSTTTPPSPTEESAISDFLLSRSLARYRGHLSDLRIQIKYHVGTVESQITALQSVRKAWRSNLPTLFTDFGNELIVGNDDKTKKIELRLRIERLKADGWRRKRFDGSRYQALCEKALVELG